MLNENENSEEKWYKNRQIYERGVFRTLWNIYNGMICENSSRLIAVLHGFIIQGFHLRCLKGFGIRLCKTRKSLHQVKRKKNSKWSLFIFIYDHFQLHFCIQQWFNNQWLFSIIFVCVFGVCMCVFTSIHREGFICLDQLKYQGPDH